METCNSGIFNLQSHDMVLESIHHLYKVTVFYLFLLTLDSILHLERTARNIYSFLPKMQICLTS